MPELNNGGEIDAEGLLDLLASDHQRFCEGRHYVCNCGYDDRLEAASRTLAQAHMADQARIAELEEALREAANRIRALGPYAAPWQHEVANEWVGEARAALNKGATHASE